MKILNLKRCNLIFFILLACSLPVQAKRMYNEAYYQELWCSEQKGQMEYVLPDFTRVDCLTEDHAIEFDFANKWAESIGQALHYGMMTGKKPGIVLIIEKPKQFVYYNRIVPLCEKYGITLWTMKSPLYEEKQ